MKYIHRYRGFLLEKSKYSGNCVMIKLDIPNWDNITSMISREDIYQEGDNYGIQDVPHLTLLYPIHDNNSFNSFKILDDVLDEPINFEILGIDFFESSDYDVLKFTVKDSEYLTKIHNALRNNVENSYQFDGYNPHITIGYLKKGTAKNYCKKLYFKMENQNNIVFSKNDNYTKYKWKIYV